MSGRRMLTVLMVAAMLGAGIAAVPAGGTGARAGEPLPFQDADGPATRSAPDEALRERYVTVDTSSFGLGSNRSAGHVVTFNLFDDAVVEASLTTFDVLGAGDFTWSGRVEGDGLAVISVVDGVASGRFFDDQRRAFRLRSVGGGVHVIAEVLPGPIRGEGQPRHVDAPDGQASQPAATATVQTRATYELRVLFVYSKAAMNRRGGQAAMESAIATTVAEANIALDTSDVDAQLVLADSRKVNYSESGSLFTDLDAVTDLDGVIDQVHTWRDNSAADLVVFITRDDAFCGLAWTMDANSFAPWFEQFAFSTVAEDCLDDGITTIHEIGHNLSGQHEEDQVNADDQSSGGTTEPLFRYSFGYYDDVNDFATIMAYGQFCTPNFCPSIPQFSSKTVKYQGHKTGNNKANNAKSLNMTVALASEFRTGNGSGGGGGGTATCNGLAVTQNAVAGQVLKGTAGDDVMLGTDGADTIKGRGGDDVICGEGGNDTLLGQGGKDTIFGGTGKDKIKGGGGADELFGEGGKDTLIGNRGNDTGDGGPGNDTCKSIETPISC